MAWAGNAGLVGLGRGRGGPLWVAEAPETPIGKAFLDAVKATGRPVTLDYNDGRQEGFGRVQLTTRKGWRHSSAEAYLRPAAARSNLHIVTGAHVTKVNPTPSSSPFLS